MEQAGEPGQPCQAGCFVVLPQLPTKEVAKYFFVRRKPAYGVGTPKTLNLGTTRTGGRFRVQ